jgi:hypothetical protein
MMNIDSETPEFFEAQGAVRVPVGPELLEGLRSKRGENRVFEGGGFEWVLIEPRDITGYPNSGRLSNHKKKVASTLVNQRIQPSMQTRGEIRHDCNDNQNRATV